MDFETEVLIGQSGVCANDTICRSCSKKCKAGDRQKLQCQNQKRIKTEEPAVYFASYLINCFLFRYKFYQSFCISYDGAKSDFLFILF